MESLLISKQNKTNKSKAVYFIAAIAIVGCVAGVIAAYNYQQATATTLFYTKNDLNSVTTWDLFAQWKIAHNKAYLNEEEERNRFEIFLNNYLFILNHNADASQTSTVGLNKFADLSSEEFSARVNCFNATRNKLKMKKYKKFDDIEHSNAVDWRTKNAVTPVKNQQQCGSCWSFSTTGSLEGLNAIKNGNLLSFSEQQLVDCSGSYGNQGCNGGLMDDAFEYVTAEGIELEATYPYTAADGKCKYNSGQTKFKNTGHDDVEEGNQVDLAKAVFTQPVSIAIEADQPVFQMYNGGVISSRNCGTQLDHGVLIVGYGSNANGQAYWIVKNSWGADWGEQGYVRILKSSKTNDIGICGIASTPSYPTA